MCEASRTLPAASVAILCCQACTCPPERAQVVEAGELLPLSAELRWLRLATPGHTPDSACARTTQQDWVSERSEDTQGRCAKKHRFCEDVCIRHGVANSRVHTAHASLSI